MRKYIRSFNRIISGKKYNLLTIVNPLEKRSKDGTIMWLCKCECGNFKELNTSLIGRHKSCGCIRKTCKRIKPNQKIGNLTAVERVDKINRKGIFYKFKCDCGNEKIASVSNVVSGITKSCGCLLRISRSITGKLHRKKFGESTLNFLYHNAKANAKHRKKEFNLTLDEFNKTVQQSCFYCKQSPKKVKIKGRYGHVFVNGIDRIDSSIGYAMENIVPCCKTCNSAKGQMNSQQFKEWIQRIYNNYVLNTL